MKRLLLVDIQQLTDEHRASIESAARARDWEVVFSADEARAREAAARAEVIFSGDGALLKASPNLKWFSVPSAGSEQYQGPALREREGVQLTCSSGAYGVTIAEHIVMATLMLMRREMDYGALVAGRGWARNLPVRSIRDSRVTFLGTGDIGREAAVRMRAFGPKSILGVNRRGRLPGEMFDGVTTIDRLDEALPRTDLLVMSLPGTDDTRRIMDDRRLRLLPEDAFIVNVGRGQAIDQAALAAQLHAGRFAGVALDVFEQEPLPKDDPLWDCPRLLITPHVAGNMTLKYTVDRIVALFIENFGRYCDGQPLLRAVDARQGY